jgi:hypothetical protein
MDKKDDWIQIRASKPELATLDYLADLVRTSRSNLLRMLIPYREIVDAFRCYYEAYNLDPKGIVDEFTGKAVDFLEQQMVCPSDSCISYQVQFVCKHPDRTRKVAELYCKWSKACRDIAGFRLDPVCLEDSKNFTHVAIGPDDSSDYIELVKDECRRLLAKSVETTKKLLTNLETKNV